MLATSQTTIIPAPTVAYSRGGASFTREFSRGRGSVEVVTGVKEPLVNASVAVVTSKTGSDTQFWALRASLTVFHAPSGTFITAVDTVHDLPFEEERDLIRLHNDEVWTTSKGLDKPSLSAKCKAMLEHAVRDCEGLEKAWRADLTSAREAEASIRRELATLSQHFHRAIRQTL
jgi:hypothetical protein